MTKGILGVYKSTQMIYKRINLKFSPYDVHEQFMSEIIQKHDTKAILNDQLEIFTSETTLCID